MSLSLFLLTIRQFQVLQYCNIQVQEYDQDIQMHKTFIMFICIQESEKHKIGSGIKLLFTFLSLRFFDMRRERHNFFNKRAAHFIDPNWSHRGETKNRLPSSRLESQLLSASGHDIIYVPGHFLSGVFIVTSLIDTSALRAREHLHSLYAPN